MATQYLVLQDDALAAQMDIVERRMGYKVAGETSYPFKTKTPFRVIHHPTINFSAICIPDNVPLGMKYGEDWARGKPRDYNGDTITGRPSQNEVVDRIWPTNKPLKDWQWMKDNGWNNA